MKLIAMALLMIFNVSIFAQKKVAKIIFLKGSISIDGASQKSFLKKGDWLDQGAVLQSSSKSIAKILFNDKSKMVLGPNSKMKIELFNKKDPGVINLIQGTLRSTVSKNYMQIKKDKSKLFIKTKTAAMGVRGTDFKVIFNNSNKVTSLVTFEGAVAMAKIANDQSNIRNQAALERIVSGPDAVMVRRGQFSGTLPGFKKVSLPIKMSPAQVDAMEKNTLGETSSNKKTKQKRNMIPPKVSSLGFVASDATVEKEITANIGAQEVSAVNKNVQEQRSNQVNPEGFVDDRGRIAPASGGYVDEKTALYIPPTKGSEYDPNAGVYVPDPAQGTFDQNSGEYVPPKGYKLISKGDFVKINPDSSSANGRMPASVSGSNSGESMAGVDAPTTQLLIKATDADMERLNLEQNALEFQRFNHQQFNNGGFIFNGAETSRVKFIIE